MSEQTHNALMCPGCRAIGGSGIGRGAQFWHESCWIKHLEQALRLLQGYHHTGSPDEDDVIAMGRVVDDALAGRHPPGGQR